MTKNIHNDDTNEARSSTGKSNLTDHAASHHKSVASVQLMTTSLLCFMVLMNYRLHSIAWSPQSWYELAFCNHIRRNDMNELQNYRIRETYAQ